MVANNVVLATIENGGTARVNPFNQGDQQATARRFTIGVAMQMRIHTEISNRPATFVVDRAGVLRYEHRATSFSNRPSPAQLLQELGTL